MPDGDAVILALLALAHAAIPEGLDIEATDAWEQAHEQLLDGPPGCWEAVGRASFSYDLGRYGGTRGTSAFAGRLVDGTWKDFHVESLGRVHWGRRGGETRSYDDSQLFVPLIGRLEGGTVSIGGGGDVDVETAGDDDPTNVVRDIIDELAAGVDITYAEWDDARGGVVLHRDVAIGKGQNAPAAAVTAFFPAGGRLPVSYDVRFPDTFRRGPVVVRDAKMQLRGRPDGDVVLPVAEAYSATFGALGTSFSFAQTVQYVKMVRCGG